jgi:hypothetical protein
MQFRAKFSHTGTSALSLAQIGALREKAAELVISTGSDITLDGANYAYHVWEGSGDPYSLTLSNAHPSQTGPANLSIVRGIIARVTALPPTLDPVTGAAASRRIVAIGNTGTVGSPQTATAALITELAPDWVVLAGNMSGYSGTGGTNFADSNAAFSSLFASGKTLPVLGPRDNSVTNILAQIQAALAAGPFDTRFSAGAAHYDATLGTQLVRFTALDGGKNQAGTVVREGMPVLGTGNVTDALEGIAGPSAFCHRIAACAWSPSVPGTGRSMPELSWLARSGMFDMLITSAHQGSSLTHLDLGDYRLPIVNVGAGSVSSTAVGDFTGIAEPASLVWSDDTNECLALITATPADLQVSFIDIATEAERYKAIYPRRDLPPLGQISFGASFGAAFGSITAPLELGSTFIWTAPQMGIPTPDNELTITLEPLINGLSGLSPYGIRVELLVLGA